MQHKVVRLKTMFTTPLTRMAQIIAFFVLVCFSYLATSLATTPPPPAIPLGNYSYVCDPARFTELGMDMSKFAWCNKDLPYDVRAKDLVDSMTLAEKALQLGDKAPGVPRIGLPMYYWWSEALHGVSDVGHATKFNDVVANVTSFPTVILTTASFNQSLWKTIGQVVSTEARAMRNAANAGLTYWSPNINVVRDPRWGRITETPGEDPFVVGTYASQYVRGLQDVEGTENATDLNSRPLKVAACCKHYAAYDVDAWLGVDRYHFDAIVTEQDMEETFLRPFEMCVKDGDVASVMCSYNRVNGIPTCADLNLLNRTIRGDWNLHGYIVSDCDSIEVMVHGHKWLGDTPEEASARTLRAGLDMDCGTFYPDFLNNAVALGKARESDLDKSLNYLYIVLMRLGYFDGSPQYSSLGKADICTDENIELAAEAAREGIVLLKNEDNNLPLDPKKQYNLAVVGPHANATLAMVGNYAGVPCRYVIPKDGLAKYANVTYAQGCENVLCENGSYIEEAKQASTNADVTVLFVGLDLTVEAESLDRTDLYLPGSQTDLINQVTDASKGPVILVILSAGGVDVSFAQENEKIKSIIWAGFPGQEGGSAIADVIFGKYNPGGRLPITWFKSDYVLQLPMTSMPLRPNETLGYPGRTYKFFSGTPLYPFGYGLSYTTFNYKATSPSSSINIQLGKTQQCHNIIYKVNETSPACAGVQVADSSCTEEIQVDVQVQNVGNKDGDNVVMVYASAPSGVAGAPIKQVIGFERVFVRAGETQTVTFKFNACKSFSLIDEKGYKVLPFGEHTVIVGDESTSLPITFGFQK